MSLTEHPFGSSIQCSDLADKLQAATGWEAKNRLLVQLSRQLPDWPAEQKIDAARVAGCESQVWLALTQSGEHYLISADSDSRIVKGLLTLVLTSYHGKTAAEIRQFDFSGWLESLGLQRFLSASRGNGLKAIVTKINSLI